MALRNVLLFMGGTVMLAVTSLELTALVFLLVPLVVVPILVFGRRVRRLSRVSQDRIADIASQIEESLGAVRTVQAFNHEALERRSFAGRVEQAFAVAIERVRSSIYSRVHLDN